MTLGTNSKTCLADGHSITYYREGEGEVVLLVHGITTYSFIWRNIFPNLTDMYDVIAVDLLGCGDSSKPLDVSYSLQDHADRLFTFVESLEIKNFILSAMTWVVGSVRYLPSGIRRCCLT